MSLGLARRRRDVLVRDRPVRIVAGMPAAALDAQTVTGYACSPRRSSPRVIATLCLRASKGLTKPGYVVAVVTGYLVAFKHPTPNRTSIDAIDRSRSHEH